MTAGSSILAITWMWPPQCSQTSMSMLKTRLSRCIQVIAMDGMYAGFAGAKTGHGSVPLLKAPVKPVRTPCSALGGLWPSRRRVGRSLRGWPRDC